MSGEVAQQSHSRYVAQDNLCDVNLSHLDLYGPRISSVRLSALHVQFAGQEYTMTKQISPLRQCMLDDMKFRNMSPSTQKVYTYAVANFSAFHGRSPDNLGIEQVREYRVHLMSRGLKAA